MSSTLNIGLLPEGFHICKQCLCPLLVDTLFGKRGHVRRCLHLFAVQNRVNHLRFGQCGFELLFSPFAVTLDTVRLVVGRGIIGVATYLVVEFFDRGVVDGRRQFCELLARQIGIAPGAILAEEILPPLLGPDAFRVLVIQTRLTEL